MKSFAATRKFAQRRENAFRLCVRGYEVDVHVRVAKFVRGGFTDRADFEIVEFFDSHAADIQASQEVFDAVRAGEDQPVVAVQMIDGFVETLITFGFGYVDGWAGYDSRSEVFESCDKRLRL